MRNYEIVIILNSENLDNVNIIINKYIKYIKKYNFNIYNLENIGIRKLSYMIKKMKFAYYYIINVTCEIFFISKIENKIKLEENIIRYIILRKKYKNIVKLNINN